MGQNIEIGSRTYRIEEVKGLAEKRDVWGECDRGDGRICIDAGMQEDQKRLTVWHEILEAAVDLYEVEIEHRDLTVLAAVVTDVLKHNADCKYLR